MEVGRDVDPENDPTTAEGRDDINENNDEESLLLERRQEDEARNARVSEARNAEGRGRQETVANGLGRRMRNIFSRGNPQEELQMEDIPPMSAEQQLHEYEELESNNMNQFFLDRSVEQKLEQEAALKEKFPNARVSQFDYIVDEIGEVCVRLKRANAKWYNLFDYDKRRFPTTLKGFLGEKVEIVVQRLQNEQAALDRNINLREEEVDRMEEDLEVAAPEEQDALRSEIERKEEEIRRLETERDVLQERINDLKNNMSLKDRVKLIFKKNGFTIAAVVASAGVVIGVIISNLKSGLGKVAKGMGNGLKAIGKKLGAILPGMVGAIASFIFKTAGEVVGFLGKHAWLLIVAVLLFLIEQIKKKRK